VRFERRLKSKNTVDLTPLIDVVFQLVIFFMVSSVFKTAPGIPLDLPESGTAQAITVTELRIKALSNGQVFVNYTTTDLAGLAVAIDAFMKDTPAETISALVEADRELPYQSLVQVLDALRSRGITKVGMLTTPTQGSP
jgi:biopolymer transport protein ExbD